MLDKDYQANNKLSFEELLQLHKQIKHDINRLYIRLYELSESQGFTNCGDCTGTHSQGFSISNVESFVIKVDELKSQINKLERKLDEIRHLLSSYINLIPSFSVREVVEYRLFTNKSWNEIGRLERYSSSRVRQFYKQGISIIKKLAKEGGV